METETDHGSSWIITAVRRICSPCSAARSARSARSAGSARGSSPSPLQRRWEKQWSAVPRVWSHSEIIFSAEMTKCFCFLYTLCEIILYILLVYFWYTFGLGMARWPDGRMALAKSLCWPQFAHKHWATQLSWSLRSDMGRTLGCTVVSQINSANSLDVLFFVR